MSRGAFIIQLAAACLLSVAGCAAPRTSVRSLTRPEHPPARPFDQWVAARRGMKRPGFVAGVATVDITPARYFGKPIAGFGFNRGATGVHDPVTGRVMVLDDGAETLVLVSVDLVGFFHDDVDRVRALVSEKHGESIVISATHNHQGPDALGYWGPALLGLVPVKSGQDETWMASVRSRLARAIITAADRARPARLRYAEIDIPDGLVKNIRVPGRYDRTLRTFQIETAAGIPLATAVNIGVHAEVLGDKNLELSADFPHWLYRALHRDGAGVGFFFPAALGGMVTGDIEMSVPLKAHFAFAQHLGESFAALARKALDGDGAQRIDKPRLTRRVHRMVLPVRNDVFELAHSLGVLKRDMGGDTHGDASDERPLRLKTEVVYAEVGPLKFLSAPGELFPSRGAWVSERLGDGPHFLLGLGNDEVGYIMSPEEFADPLYEYEQSMSPGPETWPRLEAAYDALLAPAETPAKELEAAR